MPFSPLLTLSLTPSFRSRRFCCWTQCWTYKTNQASDLKKMEKLNKVMTAIMTRGPDVDLEELEEDGAAKK